MILFGFYLVLNKIIYDNELKIINYFSESLDAIMRNIIKIFSIYFYTFFNDITFS
jgi:hypothetical protein